jgi:hypothetical protein
MEYPVKVSEIGNTQLGSMLKNLPHTIIKAE